AARLRGAAVGGRAGHGAVGSRHRGRGGRGAGDRPVPRARAARAAARRRGRAHGGGARRGGGGVPHLVGRVELAACAGRTPWHRASALTKLALALLVVMLAVLAPTLARIVPLFALALLLALTSGLPVRVIGALLLYPLAFSTLFVIAAWNGTWV